MNPFAFSGLLIGISSTAMGVWVLMKNSSSPVNRLWAIFCVSVAFWGFGGCAFGLAKDASSALLFLRLTYVGVIFIPVLFYHFVVVFLELHRRKSLVVAYLISIIFLMADATPLMLGNMTWMFGQFYFLCPPGVLYPYFVLFFVFMTSASLINLWYFMKKIENELRRTQIKWFLMATAIGFIGGSSCFLPVFGIKIYPYGNFTVALYPIIMSYAIIKHQLLDIKVVIRKTIFYSLAAFLTSIIYVFAIVATHKIMTGEWAYRLDFLNGLKNFPSLFTLTSLLCGLFSFGLAIFAGITGKSKAQKLFAAFNSAVALWGFGNFLAGISKTPETALLSWRVAYFGGFFISTFFYHLVLDFFEIKNKNILWFAYLHSIIFSALMAIHPIYFLSKIRMAFGVPYNIVTPWMAVAIWIFLILVGLSYRELLLYLQAPKNENKTQAKYFIFGFSFGFFGGMTTLLPPFGVDIIYPIGNLGVAIYVVILLYAIFRHQILDIRIVIQRTATYTVLILLISIAYILIVFAVHRFILVEKMVHANLFSNVVLILLIALFLKPLEAFLRRYVDKKFFKGTIQEISAQKDKLESELERRERLKSVGILAAGMAHEIKNPITSIKTFTEYLPTKYDDPEFREKFIRIVSDETERISGIVKDLLEFSKPSEPNKQSCGLNQILSDVTDLLGGGIFKKGIELQMSFVSNLPRVYVDPSQAKQVFLNILMNAMDAMTGERRVLRIETGVAGKHVFVAVEDTGCGMSGETSKHLFDPFFTNKATGTGLGMAITHSLIEKNGGTIHVSSDIGKGSRFVVQFPVFQA